MWGQPSSAVQERSSVVLEPLLKADPARTKLVNKASVEPHQAPFRTILLDVPPASPTKTVFLLHSYHFDSAWPAIIPGNPQPHGETSQCKFVPTPHNRQISSSVKSIVQSYRDLLVWKKSMALVLDIYRCTQAFPKIETYGLTSQLRRAAVSVPSNIAGAPLHRRIQAFSGERPRFVNGNRNPDHDCKRPGLSGKK